MFIECSPLRITNKQQPHTLSTVRAHEMLVGVKSHCTHELTPLHSTPPHSTPLHPTPPHPSADTRIFIIECPKHLIYMHYRNGQQYLDRKTAQPELAIIMIRRVYTNSCGIYIDSYMCISKKETRVITQQSLDLFT